MGARSTLVMSWVAIARPAKVGDLSIAMLAIASHRIVLFSEWGQGRVRGQGAAVRLLTLLRVDRFIRRWHPVP